MKRDVSQRTRVSFTPTAVVPPRRPPRSQCYRVQHSFEPLAGGSTQSQLCVTRAGRGCVTRACVYCKQPRSYMAARQASSPPSLGAFPRPRSSQLQNSTAASSAAAAHCGRDSVAVTLDFRSLPQSRPPLHEGGSGPVSRLAPSLLIRVCCRHHRR